MRCSSRIFFTLASRSGTSRIVYDLSKEPPAAGTALPNLPPVPPLPERGYKPRAKPASGRASSSIGWVRGASRFAHPAEHLHDALHRNDGDVVVAAARIREVNQHLRHLLQLALHQGVADLVILDQVRQAVGTEQELVPFASLHPDDVHEDVLLEADGAGDDVLQPAVLRLFLRQEARPDLLVHERM